jgi:hypothetical protein
MGQGLRVNIPFNGYTVTNVSKICGDLKAALKNSSRYQNYLLEIRYPSFCETVLNIRTDTFEKV